MTVSLVKNIALPITSWSIYVPNVQKTLLQFNDLVNPRLVDALLDDSPDPVVHWIEVRAIWWPYRSGGMKAGAVEKC
jgi:hypothetical protein